MSRSPRDQVLRKVTRLWPDVDPQAIMDVLDEYGVQGRERVHLAILKLSEGDRERLPELVQMAKRDYRDVLAYAEYPEEIKTSFAVMRTLSPKEVQAMRRRDREQYRKWLKG